MRLLLFLLLNKLLLAVDVHVVPEDVEKLVQLEVTLLTNFGSTDEETLERVASEIAEFTSHGQIFQLTSKLM